MTIDHWRGFPPVGRALGETAVGLVTALYWEDRAGVRDVPPGEGQVWVTGVSQASARMHPGTCQAQLKMDAPPPPDWKVAMTHSTSSRARRRSQLEEASWRRQILLAGRWSINIFLAVRIGW